MSGSSQPMSGGDGSPVYEPDSPLSDDTLLDLLDALVDGRGRVAAAEALGVNYRTMMACYGSRRVSRRMRQARQALEEFRKTGGVQDDEPEVIDGDSAADGKCETMAQRVVWLEDENRELRKLVEEQAGQLEALARRMDALEGTGRHPDDTTAVDAGGGQDCDFGQDWRPPRRRPGMPDAGVVTLDEQPDEEHAFGQAAPLVTEWRQLLAGGDQAVSRVDRARSSVRRWELEAQMLGEYHLTLPPETHPLDDARRAEHVQWRKDALAVAGRELAKARRLRLLRRMLTLGLWHRWIQG